MATIMICDDAIFMRQSLKKIVEEAGHTVVSEAADATQALVEYEKVKPDVVLMDITMPGIDGITAVKKLRTKDPNATIIMVSASAQKPKVVDAINAGATDFIVKPFQKERVIGCIEKCLR